MKTGLEIQLTDEGAVVEDSTRDRVHFLNPTAALVLSLCDGSLHPEAGLLSSGNG
jgi:hypothetical protein